MRTLITGFHSDLAQAIIARRKRLGDDVIATSTRPPAESGDTEVVPFDLAKPEASQLGRVLDKGVDALILNAASRVGELRSLHEVPFEEMREYMRVNVEGNLWLIQKVLPVMLKQSFGRILFISSISSTAGTSGYGMYCAAKAALEGLIFNLSVDYGDQGIFSNVLRPGILATARTQEFWSRPGYQKIASKTIPAGKIGTCEQVAEATDPLLSRVSYINGAVLDVSGGLPRIRSRGLS